MPKLMLQFEGQVLKEILVGQTVTIGRSPGNNVFIDNPAVSSRHARVIREGDGFVLEDLHSTNGTFVNEQRVTRHPLQHGDVVLVGKHELVFQRTTDDAPAVSPEAEPKPELDGTMFLDTARQRELLAQAEAAHPAADGPTATMPVPKAPPAKIGVLQVLAGRADQPEYVLRAQTSLIGKSDAAVVPLKGWFKPKTAVAIARKGQGYEVTLLGGKTLVNNQPLVGRRELKDGDVLQVSGLTLEFRLKG
jgi:pSer/pThr/pTyr-binding forkhead associated (FHA) protein